MYDVAVIGAGPAGTSAAITAAGYGASVLLLEKGKFPRQRVCGEFVSAESLALLTSLLSATSGLLERAPRLHCARVFVDGSMLEMPLEAPAASIPRIELDAALWNSAKAGGVDGREGHSVLTVEGPAPFAIRTADQNHFLARSLIDASGRWSNLNSRPNENTAGSAGKWIGVKAHFRESAPASSVDLYFFAGGYCGVQPVACGGETRINVCAMIRSAVGKSLQETFPQHPALYKRSQGWHIATEMAATSPLIFYQPEPFTNGVLRAGDAAGFVDPFIGDGISLALRGGVMAAQSLRSFFHGRSSLQQAGEMYEATYRRDLMHVFQTSSIIRRLLGLPAPIRTGIVRLLAGFPALTGYMVRHTR